MKRVILIATFALLLLTVAGITDAAAQCAMCRMQVENNVSSGESSIGAGLNKGILFLLTMPYLIFAVIAFFWYRHSRKENEKRIQTAGYYRG
jgi:hypothetical protein